MKKWIILMSTGLILTACGETADQQNEEPAGTEETTESSINNSQTSSSGESSGTIESSQAQEENTENRSEDTEESSEEATNEAQTVIDKAKNQLNNGETDKASLTIRTLKEEQGDNLTENELSQIEEVKQNLANEKVDQAKDNQSSEHQEVRQSTVMQEDYKESSGKNLEDASDEEVEKWLNEQDAADSENTSQSNTAENNQNQNSSNNQPKTKEELKNYALTQVTEQTGLLSEDYTYFVDLKEDNWATVEIREEQSDGATEWTTMVGLYRYNVETDTLEKMNPVSGEFN